MRYMIVDGDLLDAGLTEIADAIRETAGTSELLEFPAEMKGAVKAIPGILAGEFSEDLGRIETVATEAKTAAEGAQTTANNAKAAADEALDAAESVQGIATEAKTTAEGAQTAAGNAMSKANEAMAAAESVQTTATNAKTTAETAQTTANSAKTTAENAQTAAGNAMTAASNAQTRAETAESNAKAYADSRHINGTVTLKYNSWVNNAQTVSFSGVTADITKTDVYAYPAPADDNYAAYVESGVRPYAQGDNTITFKCEDVPAVNLTVNVSVEFVGSRN